jgi:hypothetical protein
MKVDNFKKTIVIFALKNNRLFILRILTPFQLSILYSVESDENLMNPIVHTVVTVRGLKNT